MWPGRCRLVGVDSGSASTRRVWDRSAALMPVPLEAGRTYAFVARENFLDADTPQVDLVSYDLVADLP